MLSGHYGCVCLLVLYMLWVCGEIGVGQNDEMSEDQWDGGYWLPGHL